MAGMMPTNTAAPVPAQGGPAPSAPPQPANDNGQQASPEEQQQYDQFVGRAMQLIYDPKMFPHILEMLKGGADASPAQPDAEGARDQPAGAADHGASGPAQGLAHATVMVLAKVGSAAEQAGQKLSPDVVFHGGSEIFSQLAEVSDKAGISDYANDRNQLEAAYYLTIDLATQQMAQSGEIDQAGAKQAMDQLVQMDAKGELEQIFKGLDAKDQGGKQPAANDNSGLSGGMAPKG